MGVAEKFTTLCDNFKFTSDQLAVIASRRDGIAKRLNKDFRGLEASTDHIFFAGSYGRNTAITKLSDFDIVSILPYEVYDKYNKYQTNGQSQLLQAVKTSLAKTYSRTELKGDGQVVQVFFTDGTVYEVLPAFLNSGGSYTFPDSNNGGSWKVTKPKEEIAEVARLDSLYNNNLKRLCRMARSWSYNCNVDISGLLIDTLAAKFIPDWLYNDKSYFYYDYMSRDFFLYLSDQKERKQWYAVGSGQLIKRNGEFEAKAKKAYNKAVEAISDWDKGNEWTATQKWREIYGNFFPNS